MAKKKSVQRSSKTFSVGDAITYGWDQVKSRLKFFIVLVLIIGLASSIPNILTSAAESRNEGTLSLILNIAGIILQLAIALGAIGIALHVYDRKKTGYGDLFQQFKLIPQYIIASILYMLIVIGGLILFIIPGIIWSVKFQFFAYLMVDKGLGPIEALKESTRITDGVKWKLFFLKIVLSLINVAGLLCFVVGLLVTIPLGMMAEAYAYRKLQPK